MTRRFPAVLFLIGTGLCSIPGQAAEHGSDMACTFDPASRTAEYINLINERSARERRVAERSAVQMPARRVLIPKAPPAAEMSLLERVALAQAMDRYFRDNPGQIPDLRKAQ